MKTATPTPTPKFALLEDSYHLRVSNAAVKLELAHKRYVDEGTFRAVALKWLESATNFTVTAARKDYEKQTKRYNEAKEAYVDAMAAYNEIMADFTSKAGNPV